MPQLLPPQQRRIPDRTSQETLRSLRPEYNERVSGVYLDLRLGNPISLRPLFEERTYEAKVVGLEPYQYFMVQARMPQDTLARLQASPALAARLSLGGMASLFYTTMLSRVSVPASVLFLAYPETLQRVVLRRSRRMRVSIPCSVHGAFGDHQGMVVDMDAAGCRFNVRSHLSSPLRKARPGELVVLNCSLLQPDPPLTTSLLLRRVEEDKGRITMGGQFEGLGDGDRRQVEDYMRRMEPLADNG